MVKGDGNKDVVIRHTVTDIIDCFDENKSREKSLEKYYIDGKDRNARIGQNLLKEMENIIRSRTENIDPNDSSLMAFIREYLNKVCASNVSDIIGKLMALNYSTQKHFELLAQELIMKAMNDVMAHKGMESRDRTTSEICVEISQTFFRFCLQDDDVSFGRVLCNMCNHYFKSFMDVTLDKADKKTAFMNQFNPQRVNNYKGLANFIGLMYVAKLFPHAIIMTCLTKIKKMIVETDLSQEECDYYYTGYNRLMSHVLAKFDINEPDEVLVQEFFAIVKRLETLNGSILNESLKNAKAESRTERKNSVRKYSIGVHRITIGKLEGLKERYTELRDNPPVREEDETAETAETAEIAEIAEIAE